MSSIEGILPDNHPASWTPDSNIRFTHVYTLFQYRYVVNQGIERQLSLPPPTQGKLISYPDLALIPSTMAATLFPVQFTDSPVGFMLSLPSLSDKDAGIRQSPTRPSAIARPPGSAII